MLVVLTFLFPSIVNAEVKITNFKETIEEEIKVFGSAQGYEEYINTLKKADLSGYKESKDKINVYIFRGETCGYCLKSIAYFASIVKDYGKYFNLITYEVNKNSDNAALMNNVAQVFGEKTAGVPYMVIGDKTFTGYSEDDNSAIEAQIKKTYSSKDRYDVMNNLDKIKDVPNENTANGENDTFRGTNDEVTSSSKDDKTNIGLVLIFQVILSVIVVIYIHIRHNMLKKEIESLKDEIIKTRKTQK